MIEGGQCTSAVKADCQTVICAPSTAINVSLDDVIGVMWSPINVECVLTGRGGLWKSRNSEMYIQVTARVMGECDEQTRN